MGKIQDVQVIKSPIRVDKKIKLLLTNHHFFDYTGSEVYTLTLAEHLKKLGLDVIIYSPFVGKKLIEEVKKFNIEVYSDLNEIKNEKFDLAHVHHSTTAIEVRHFFPELPIIYLSHGVLPFLEQPPVINLNIFDFISISDETERNLQKKVDDSVSFYKFTNIVDNEKFFPFTPINESPKSILIISSRLDEAKAKTIKQACLRIGLNYRFIGGKFGKVNSDELAKLINNADIVFSLGRGAIEAMMCGRVPLIYDYLGGDGLVTPENFHEIRKNNFSGRRYSQHFTVDELIQEINKYQQSYGEDLLKLANKYFSAEIWTNKMPEYYAEVLNKNIPLLSASDKELISFFYNSIKESRIYANMVNEEINANNIYSDEKIKEKISASEKNIELGKYKEASEILSDILEVCPGNIDALNNLARIKLKLGEISEAISKFYEVLSIDSNNSLAVKYLEGVSQTIANLASKANVDRNIVFGIIDAPKPYEIIKNTVTIYGWVLSKFGDLDIQLLLDNKHVLNISRGERNDVMNDYPEFTCCKYPGFGIELNSEELNNGSHELICYAIFRNKIYKVAKTIFSVKNKI